MSVNSTNNNVKTDSYLAAAAGATISGATVSGVNNFRLKKLADKTVKAFNSTPTECDQFVKKNNEFLTRAVEAKKGFFGKINKSLKGLSNPDEIAETVKKSSSDLIDGYRNNAARKIGRTPVRKPFHGSFSGRRRSSGFPSRRAHRQTLRVGSFMMRGTLKALRTHGRHSSTPHSGSWPFRMGRQPN